MYKFKEILFSRKQFYKGFTLIEVLISVGILSIIVGLGGDILATVIRSYQKAELFNLVDKNGSYALSLIEQEIRSSISVKLYESDGSISTDDDGFGLELTLPTSPTPTVKTYTIGYCTSSSPGTVKLNGNDIVLNSVDTAVTGQQLNVMSFDSANPASPPFVRVSDPTGQSSFDIIYVSFAVGAGDDGSGGGACAAPLNRAYFQTSVN